MTAPALVALRLPDPASSWAAAGFTVDGDRTCVGALVLVFDADSPDPALAFDRAHPAGAAELDGIGWLVVEPSADPGPAPSHPNGIDGTDHVVIMAPDLDRVRRALLDAGLEIRRERPTRIAGTAVTQLFAVAGEVLLEIVAPESPSGDGPSTIWGLAFAAPDLDATASWFGDRCSPPRDAVQAGRRIATVRHHDFAITPTVAVMSPR